jgi:hypothetical protein
MKYKDIDFHIYTPELSISQSFRAISQLAQNKSIRHIEYTNLIDTEEECIEWHALYEDREGETWHIDMIHILKDSKYDGYFERMAARISAILTDETRNVILRLKYETPDDVRIMGVQYCQAVLRDNIRTYAELTSWLDRNPVTGIIEWIP